MNCSIFICFAEVVCCLPRSLMRTMLNAFVLSHLHYSLPVIQSINQQLICSLERQLNWAIKACYFRSKFESSRDLKISNQILPISLFIKYKRVSYFWKIRQKRLPAVANISCRPLPTQNLKENNRTGQLFQISSQVGANWKTVFHFASAWLDILEKLACSNVFFKIPGWQRSA